MAVIRGREEGGQEVLVRPAIGLVDFMYVRRLRNAVRFNMTGDTGRIGIFRQILFLLDPPAGVELYVAEIEGKRAGYLLLREKGETTLITEAVDQAFRRRGVASELIRHAKKCRGNITAHVLADNAPSRALHEQAGFLQVGVRDSIVIYQFTR